MTRTPHPVRGAYSYARDDIPCPTCGAEPYDWCAQSGGTPRHVPCVARLTKPDTPTEGCVLNTAQKPVQGRLTAIPTR